MGKANLYAIYDGEEEILRGSAKEITKKFGIVGSDLYQYTNRGLRIQRQYRIVKLGKIEKRTEEKPVETDDEQKAFMETYEVIKSHLLKYGNVYSRTDGSEYKKMLEQEQIYFDARQFGENDYILTRL